MTTLCIVLLILAVPFVISLAFLVVVLCAHTVADPDPEYSDLDRRDGLGWSDQ